MEQFTANEVRACKKALASVSGTGAAQEMLNAFADLLEAQEKAVPVRQFRVVPKGSTWNDVKDDEIWAVVTAHPESYETRVLYTHPAQAQPRETMTPRELAKLIERGENWKMVEEPSQAQPPAVSVTEEMVERARSAFVQADDGSTGITDAIRAALLAVHSAQAQPPAASVPGVSAQAHENAQAALAAQENPNGV